MDEPETRYAKTTDGVHIAYQALGAGPLDLIYIAPYFSHLEINWEHPEYAAFLRRLASFCRLIMYDRRGNGLSDPVPVDAAPILEARIDDILAVMDAVGSERAVVYGASESGALAALFAAMHPERVVALVIYGSAARNAWAADYPWGQTADQHEVEVAEIERTWGTSEYVRRTWPEVTDESLARWAAALSRRAMSPGAAAAYEDMWWRIDVRDALPVIHVPTIILHREHDNPEENRYLAEHIAGARLTALPGKEHFPFLGDRDSVTNAIESFVRSVREEEAALDRVMAAVMFTDIVGSTETVSRLGDHGWGEVLERHHAIVRSFLTRYQGKEIDTAGDGFFATFDGPGRAVKCAGAIVESLRALGIQVRVGLHAGEVQMVAGKVGGLAVSIGARIGSIAGPSEVLVSRTVKDLVAGSGLVFEDVGEHELKGVPDRWRLYRVVDGRTST